MKTYLGAALVGYACHLLQPHQPQSAIATVLLIGAFWSYTWNTGR